MHVMPKTFLPNKVSDNSVRYLMCRVLASLTTQLMLTRKPTLMTTGKAASSLQNLPKL
jgi:hypothetical protein